MPAKTAHRCLFGHIAIRDENDLKDMYASAEARVSRGIRAPRGR
jgi:hypothetical protein